MPSTVSSCCWWGEADHVDICRRTKGLPLSDGLDVFRCTRISCEKKDTAGLRAGELCAIKEDFAQTQVIAKCCVFVIVLICLSGCRTPRSVTHTETLPAKETAGTLSERDSLPRTIAKTDASHESAFLLVSAQDDSIIGTDQTTPAAESNAGEDINNDLPETDNTGNTTTLELNPQPDPYESNERSVLQAITLERVIDSVHESFPMVQAAYQERTIASGNQTSAWGEFDTKLKAASENGPLGFYETYRNSAGFSKPLYGGGEVFGGYRNGGGSFQPWYLERETNAGGEFKAGVRVPLIRNRNIDARRAALWRATYDQQIADPVIRTALIEFSRDAGLAYWKWVAAGQKYRVGRQWLELARSRNNQIRRRVEEEDLDPPEQIDNERAIAKREAKLADSLRILQQAAAKLSLFLRDENGFPVVPTGDIVPEFPPLRIVSFDRLDSDIAMAQAGRPELQALDLMLRQLQVDYSEAANMTRPALDAQLVGSQDVGEPTSSKRDKSQFEVEAGLFFDVPLQKRKGRGKMQAVQAKMSQVSAKRRLVGDKIAADVQAAYAGLQQSYQEVIKAREAVRLASRMAEIERIKFREGASDMLKVALREQYAIEAAEEVITATYNHFVAFTEFAATLAMERPELNLLPAADDNPADVNL